jgi:DNA-binding NarL/FixJ family response regulator
MEAIVIFAESALGLLELGMGHFDAAFRPLAEVERLMREGEVGEPGVLWWAGDYIDAARRSGRVREAASVLRALERQASATGSVWAHAVAARGRGSLAGAATYAQEFDDALVRHCELDAPFELARTQLAYAERLSEYEEREVAARHAEKARELFDRIGAAPWAARAGVLTGSSAQPHRSVRDVLTDREFEVASVVGRGASNQEAAAELYLSVKTIDFHLRNAYRKLGLTSRTQLAVVLERQGLLSSAP